MGKTNTRLTNALLLQCALTNGVRFAYEQKSKIIEGGVESLAYSGIPLTYSTIVDNCIVFGMISTQLFLALRDVMLIGQKIYRISADLPRVGARIYSATTLVR